MLTFPAHIKPVGFSPDSIHIVVKRKDGTKLSIHPLHLKCIPILPGKSEKKPI